LRPPPHHPSLPCLFHAPPTTETYTLSLHDALPICKVSPTRLRRQGAMARLTDYLSYADAQTYCTPSGLWELFDGDRERLNIAHECIDRHAGGGRPAVILVRASGNDEVLGFDELARESSRFAHALVARGIQPGDRVAVMLEPSREFYVALFGAIKMGAIAVPLFTLFG